MLWCLRTAPLRSRLGLERATDVGDWSCHLVSVSSMRLGWAVGGVAWSYVVVNGGDISL